VLCFLGQQAYSQDRFFEISLHLMFFNIFSRPALFVVFIALFGIQGFLVLVLRLFLLAPAG